MADINVGEILGLAIVGGIAMNMTSGMNRRSRDEEDEERVTRRKKKKLTTTKQYYNTPW